MHEHLQDAASLSAYLSASMRAVSRCFSLLLATYNYGTPPRPYAAEDFGYSI